MGSSGAGKTTLLNILAGHVNLGVSGTIKVNGKPKKQKVFEKISAYIMQEDKLQGKSFSTHSDFRQRLIAKFIIMVIKQFVHLSFVILILIFWSYHDRHS